MKVIATDNFKQATIEALLHAKNPNDPKNRAKLTKLIEDEGLNPYTFGGQYVINNLEGDELANEVKQYENTANKQAALGDQQPLFPDAPIPMKPQKPQLSGNLLEDLDYLGNFNLTVPQLAQRYKTKATQFHKGYFSIPYNGKIYIVEDDGTYKEAHEWLDRLFEHELMQFINIPDFNKQFWEYPPHVLYHGTNPEFVPSILKTGLKVKCETRGLANRHVGCAVFTSPEIEGTHGYGIATIAINVAQMKADGFMPPVQTEEGFDEKNAKESLAHKIGLDDYYYELSDSSVSEDTIVFFDNIPPKYLSEVN